ncbi:hypothetical protein [Pedomonas sp. V897]|uniref:hypothetical protein n=1 Tax=Pedomonas sp. V897 TaxID=3446482 RepID=UPI003EE41369
MTALQARVNGVNSVENQAVQQKAAVAGPESHAKQALRRNRRRPGLYQPVGVHFPLFHAWRP